MFKLNIDPSEIQILSHEYFMYEALKQAVQAFETGEVPIGAVIVSENRIIAKAYNQTQLLNDVTAHAEMLAITAATNFIGGKYLTNCSIYVTVEPCVMCAGALYWSQISSIYYGASDSKRGYSNFSKTLLHPKTEVSYGIFENESKRIMQDFFKVRR
jgi:tRNA(adenine34) deaminase